MSPLTHVWRASTVSFRRWPATARQRALRWLLAALTAAELGSSAATFAEAATSPLASPQPSASSALPGGWLLARAPIPGSGQSSVAVIHAVDPLRSDLGVAGLMLRCGRFGFDTIVVVVTPYPPTAAPQVTLVSGTERRTFTASVLPTGAALALPAAASDLARTVWRRAAELSVSIVDAGEAVNGVIPIPDLDGALTALSGHCAAP